MLSFNLEALVPRLKKDLEQSDCATHIEMAKRIGDTEGIFGWSWLRLADAFVELAEAYQAEQVLNEELKLRLLQQEVRFRE